MFSTQTLNQYKMFNQYGNSHNYNNDLNYEQRQRLFVNNLSTDEKYSAFMSRIMTNMKNSTNNRDIPASNIKKRVFNPFVSSIPLHIIKPVVLQEIKPLSTSFEKSDEMKFVSKLEIRLYTKPTKLNFDSNIQPGLNKKHQEIRFISDERKIDRSNMDKK